MEGLDFTSGDELQIDPVAGSSQLRELVDVRSQTDVRLEEIPLIYDDPAALAALKILQEKGYSSDQVKEAFEGLQPVPITKARIRQVKRSSLDMRVKTEAARILGVRNINPEGQELDRKRLGRTNLIVMKAAIDRQVNTAVGRKAGERSDFTRPQLDEIDKKFVALVEQAVQEVFNSKN
jgi:hypothetical protein